MYYTYLHMTPSEEIFYVGKGKGHRAFSHHDRSQEWKSFVLQKKGLIVKIIAEWETEEEAFEHENLLITSLNSIGCKLLNKTDGGRGVRGYKQSQELKDHKSRLLKGYKHKIVTCPHCNKTGGETSMKRWHFNNCQGLKIYRARVTVNGKRIHLGRFATQEEANKQKRITGEK